MLFKRLVKHRSSKYGWHIYNRCFHDECRKQGKFEQLDVVSFDHKSCVLASLTVNYMYLFSPKGYRAAYSVFLLCFAQDISDSIFRTISYKHSLVNLNIEIMFTACFC